MIHRSVFEAVGVFDTDFPVCEDYDLWLRITANYPVLLIAEPQIKASGGESIASIASATARVPLTRLSVIRRFLDGVQSPITLSPAR